MTILHAYVVRQSKIFCLVYSLFKPFVEERMRKMVSYLSIHFQSADVSTASNHF